MRRALILLSIPWFFACQLSESAGAKRSGGTAPKNGTAQTKQQTTSDDQGATTCRAQCVGGGGGGGGGGANDDAASIDGDHERCKSSCDSDSDCVNDCDLTRQSACAELQCGLSSSGDD